MRTRASKPRRTMVVTVSAILALGIAFAPAALAGGGVPSKVLRMVNATRDHHDLHSLRMEPGCKNLRVWGVRSNFYNIILQRMLSAVHYYCG